MHDDLESIFDGVTERVVVPPGNLAEVVRRGRARRMRRTAAGLTGLAAVAAVAWAFAVIYEPAMRPVPATVPTPGPLPERLVPVRMTAPAPSPELAAAGDIENARAVTVAFHALLDRTSRYSFDYEDVRRTDEGWDVFFREVRKASRLERELQERVVELETHLERQLAARHDLQREAERAPGRAENAREKARELERQAARLAREAARLEERLREGRARLAREAARLEERLREARQRRPSLEVVVSVVERDGVVFVEEATTSSSTVPSLKRVPGYAERTDDVDAWGNDYYRVRFRRIDAADVRVTFRSFWTGPLGAPYEESCRQEVVDADGRLVSVSPGPRVPPSAPEHYDRAPSTEDGRDGTEIGFGFEHRGPVEELSLRMLCAWRLPR